ncbi:hypothetical protein E2C01_062424 [Portunus trituberculatus]|uniref:Uncharacterized protein n=1 Tax=Portunus trituberculatus TaxID=210409 RepID=A0A5B7HE05_PORTR|nr:hypothetical protein [Portunus trituberculatus]
MQSLLNSLLSHFLTSGHTFHKQSLTHTTQPGHSHPSSYLVRSMVDLSAIASKPGPMGCTSLRVSRKYLHGTTVLLEEGDQVSE